MGDPRAVVIQLEELRSEATTMGTLAASRRKARDEPRLVVVNTETAEVHQETTNGRSRPDILQWLTSLLSR